MRRMIVRIVIWIWGVVVEIWVTSQRGPWRVVGIIMRIPVERGAVIWWMVIKT